MNINKVLSNIKFDDFLTILNTCSKTILYEKNTYLLTVLSAEPTISIENLTHKLFIYCINRLYKRNVSYYILFDTDTVFMFCNSKGLLDETILNKFKSLFISITPEMNIYFLNSMTDDDKNYLSKIHSQFLKDIYKFNELKIESDKKFLTQYLQYVKITPVHFTILLQLYPDLNQTVLNNISDKQFVKSIYSVLIKFNSNAFTSEFLNTHYLILISGLIEKQVIFDLTSTSIFFKLSPFVQKKIKDFLN